MIELVFLACLKADPDTCGERVVKFIPTTDAALCMAYAQPELAAWVNNHPDHAISRWWCNDTARGELAEGTSASP